MNSGQNSNKFDTRSFLGNAPGKTHKGKTSRDFLLIELIGKNSELQQQKYFIKLIQYLSLFPSTMSFLKTVPKAALKKRASAVWPVRPCTVSTISKTASKNVPENCCSVQYTTVRILQQ
jgi:hypothetical protein